MLHVRKAIEHGLLQKHFRKLTKGQKALSVFQIVLCGGFFALCLSDVLDINANFSAVRFFLNIFYALAFFSLTAFALSDLKQKSKSMSG